MKYILIIVMATGTRYGGTNVSMQEFNNKLNCELALTYVIGENIIITEINSYKLKAKCLIK